MLRHPCYLLSIFLQFVSTFSSANIPQKAEKDLCPAWVQDFLPTNRLCENRTRLTITPIKGFGNKLNGVVQGAVGAYIMNRCLLIDWNYNDMLSFTQESVKKAEFNILKQKQARKKKLPKFYFPKGKLGFKKFVANKYTKEFVVEMGVGYRDRLCKLLHSVEPNALSLGLSEQVIKKTQRKNSLCGFLEGCILHQVLTPSLELESILTDYRRMWLRNSTVSVAIQIRMGDRLSYHSTGIQGTQSHDERIPIKMLKMFWMAAKSYAATVRSREGQTSTTYFIATDNRLALEAAKQALGPRNIFFIEGSFHHSDSESEDKSSAKKMLLDWYLLSEADIVIQGPWSSFVEKALVYSRKNQKIIRCHPLTNTETRKDWIVKLDGWACFQNLLKDTFKGPRAVDIPE